MSFNSEKFAELLKVALGDRSINKLGNDSGVDPGYISRLLRCKIKNPPSAEIINKLAGKAYNGITATALLEAAGYLPGINIHHSTQKPKDLAKFLEQSEVMFDGETYHLDEEDKEKLRSALEYAFWHAKQKNKRKKS